MVPMALIWWIYHFWARFWPYFNFVDFRAYFGPFSPIWPSPLLSKSLKISSNHFSARTDPLFRYSSLVTWPNRRKVSVQNCNQNISDPSLFSYEPHLLHFLKTDFPILIRVNACKAADIWRIRVWNSCPSSAPLPPPVEISSHWTDLGDSCEYSQCPLFWRSLRQFGRQGPLWQSAIFSMMGWLSIGLAP